MSGSIVLCTRLACAGPPLTNVANCKTPDVALKTLQQDAAARPECYSVGLGNSACSAVSRSQRTLLSYQPEKIAPSFSLMALTTVHVTRAYSFDPQALRGPCRQQLAISRISVKAALIVKMYNRIGPHISRNDHRQPDVYSTIGPAAVSELCRVCAYYRMPPPILLAPRLSTRPLSFDSIIGFCIISSFKKVWPL